MLLRKLTAALLPLLLCVVFCAALRLLDGWLGAGGFWVFALKGVLLGGLLALVLPIAGVRAHTNGLTPWLFTGAGVLLAVLLYQYMETIGTLHSAFLSRRIEEYLTSKRSVFAGYAKFFFIIIFYIEKTYTKPAVSDFSARNKIFD